MIFDSLVVGIMSYCAEIREWKKIPKLEKAQKKYLKLELCITQ